MSPVIYTSSVSKSVKLTESEMFHLIEEYACNNINYGYTLADYQSVLDLCEREADEFRERKCTVFKCEKEAKRTELDTDEINPTTIRLIAIMQKYPAYFEMLLSFFYPFTKEQLKEYEESLNWANLSENLFLDWDEDLLMEFEYNWEWSSIGQHIIGTKKLANPELLLKYYEKEYIDAEDILENQIYDYYYTFWNPEFTCEEVSQLLLKNEQLRLEMEEAVKHMEEITIHPSESRSNAVERVGALVENEYENFKREAETARYENFQNQPKELDEIISFLERKGEILDVFYICRALTCNKEPDPFYCDNPFKNGFDYTFNSPEKKKILNDAVKVFLREES